MTCFTVAAAASLGMVLSAQNPTTTAPDTAGKSAQQLFNELPWPIRLGVRSHRVQEAFPLVDRVVLVPDAATYIDEVGKWSLQGGRWPVLFEDKRYAPMFVRRFQPRQLIRRESVGAVQPSAQQVEHAIIRVFGGDPSRQDLRATFASHQYEPPGVVISSMSDPAWTAALALGAGHGQPIAWLDGDFGQPDGQLDSTAAASLAAAVNDAVRRQGWPSEALGDSIDAVTFCRDMAARAVVSGEEPVATIDLLARNADNTRYAIGGWIFGDSVRSAYAAMCALFLPREEVWLWNSYPTEGEWGLFGTTQAADLLQTRGFKVRDNVGPNASEAAWLRSLIGGLTADVVFVNSKGYTDFFELSEGRGHPYDAPTLNTPAIVHFIHSWSMNQPANTSCVGGAWIDRGAYAAVGSVHEPFLSAFVAPGDIANRCVNFVPYLAAARWWAPGQGMGHPWRVMTYGDPLMLCASPKPPPDGAGKARIIAAADYGLDLTEHVKQRMRDTKTDQTGEAYADALTILDMLGRDDIALPLWKAADNAGKGSVAARAALPVLFRMRDVDQFMKAWDQLRERDPQCADMLWQLLWPRVAGGRPDPDLLMQLQSAIRQPVPLFDLRRLAPLLRAAFDEAHTREVIDREAERTSLPHVRDALRELAKEL